MINQTKFNKIDNYNTSINIISSIKEPIVIMDAISSYFSEIETNVEFNLRTEKSRARFESAIKNEFLQFKNEDHKNLIKEIYTRNIPMKDKEMALFWQFIINNRLFRELSIKVFSKIYFSGRISISKEDIIAYIKEFICINSTSQSNWSESTINIIASKYLNFMKKLGFITSGRIKNFNFINPSSEAQVLFIYFTNIYSHNLYNFWDNELLPINFISEKDLIEKYKKLSLKGYFDIEIKGNVMNIKLKHSFKGIFDVLYN